MKLFLSIALSLLAIAFTACDDEKDNPSGNNNPEPFEYLYEAEEFAGNWVLEHNISVINLDIAKVNDSTLSFNVLGGENVDLESGNYRMMKEPSSTSNAFKYYLEWKSEANNDYCRLFIDEKIGEGFSGEYISNKYNVWMDTYTLKKR